MKLRKIIALSLTFFSLMLVACNSNTSHFQSISNESSNDNSNYFISSSSNNPSNDDLSSSSNQLSSSSTSSNEQPQYDLHPISSDVMVLYARTTIGVYVEPGPSCTIGSLYEYYNSSPNYLSMFQGKQKVYNLAAESKIHCYYVSKDVHDAVETILAVIGRTNGIPWRNLNAYIYGYNYGKGSTLFSEELLNQPIMEAVLSDETEHIAAMVDGYYFLDIVRYFNDLDYDGFSFIDFVPYQFNDNEIKIDNSGFIKTYRCLVCRSNNPNVRPEGCMFQYFSHVDYGSGIEILTKDNVEVLRDKRFLYDTYKDANYYDKLDECILEKTYVETSLRGDVFDIIFNYQKTMTLLGL